MIRHLDTCTLPEATLPRAAAPPYPAPERDIGLAERRRAVVQLQALRNDDVARELQRDLLQHGGGHNRYALALPYGLALTHGRRIVFSPRLAANADDRRPYLPLQRLEPRHLRGVDDLTACVAEVRAELSALHLDASRRGASVCHVRQRGGHCGPSHASWATAAFCYVGAWILCCPVMSLYEAVRIEVRREQHAPAAQAPRGPHAPAHTAPSVPSPG